MIAAAQAGREVLEMLTALADQPPDAIPSEHSEESEVGD